MKIKSIVDSINCVDFLNKIDNLIFKMLYDEKDGYVLMQSKDAIDKAQNYVEKFDSQLDEIIQNQDLNSVKLLVEEKRSEFLSKIREHYIVQTMKRADEVYENMEENSLLGAYINKNHKEMLDKIYNRMLCAISWLANVKKLDENQKENIFQNFKVKFQNSINSKDSDFLNQFSNRTTDYKVFFQVFNLILDDEEKFLSLDLKNRYLNNLSNEDLNYLFLIQNNLKTYKNSSKKDELALIRATIEISNLKDEKEKYSLLKAIDNDFKNYFSENKKLDETERIKLAKKRLDIILKHKKSNCEYYKKLLSSKNSTSLNE